MSYNPKSLFNKIQAKEQAAAESVNSPANFTNPLLFKPKVGTTYAVRLLWLPPEKGYDREYPMINSYIHRIWDDNATNGNKDHKVICPTSQYMMGEVSSAFRKCPICTAASEFYKQGQEGSESAKELYNKFRRTCVGYVPIYIVNGPEDSIGQIKILQYGKQFKDFFDSKIFGIKKQNKNEDIPTVLDEEAIGLEAFMYYDETADKLVNTGYDLLITTTTKKMIIGGKQIDMPQYQLDFSRRPRTITEFDGIEIDSEEGIKYFNALNSSVLHYDQDFYIKSTEEELHEFKLNFISGESVETPVVETKKPAISLPKKPVVAEPEIDEVKDEIPYEFPTKPAKSTRVAKPVEVEAESEVALPNDSDIDDLINDLT